MNKQNKTFQLCYLLDRSGGGWAANVIITLQEDVFNFLAVSYYAMDDEGDSLKHLTETAFRLLTKRSKQEKVLFIQDEGAMELSLKCSPQGLDVVLTHISQYGHSKRVKASVTTSEHYALEVRQLLDKIYVEFGEAGYQEFWEHSIFPMRAYEKLAKQLSQLNNS